MPRPVAIGGIGGSGTRLFARYLVELGFDIGYDLNESLDNLAFTLLFKRTDILTASAEDFRALTDIFFDRFTAPGRDCTTAIAPFREALLAERSQHAPDWLAARLKKLLERHDSQPAMRWGWKEPNTHVVIDRLLRQRDDLVYVHVMRHGIDMAHVDNRNQLALWGEIFLDRPVTIGPRDALAYWCAVHQRLRELQETFGPRILLVKYEDMIEDPVTGCGRIAALAGVDDWQPAFERLRELVAAGKTTGAFREVDRSVFDPRDLETVASFGYELE